MRSDLWKNLTEQWNLWSHAGELGPPKKLFFSSKPHYNPKILYGEMSEGQRTSCCGSPSSQWLLQSVPTDVVILTHGELQWAPDQRIRAVPKITYSYREGRGVPNVEDELHAHPREMLAWTLDSKGK